MKYLVTGGAGFVGSHLCEDLLDRGHEVVALDNLATGQTENVGQLDGHSRFRLVVGDVLNPEELGPLIGECDAVFHLAATVGVRRIMEEPVETLITNVRGTEEVLKFAASFGKKVLLASTSEVYGRTLDVNGHVHCLNEEHDSTLGPTSKRRWAYASSKALDEFLTLAYHDEKGLPVVIVRLFNTVGPRQTGRYGMVVPRFVQRALTDEPLIVHGSGEQSRSFTHVADAVRGIADLMECREAIGEVVNVGNGAKITINRLAEKVVELTGSESEIHHVPYEDVYGPGFEDMQRRTPDISKLRALTGFEPQHDIDSVLLDVIEYFRSRELETDDVPSFLRGRE